MSNQLDVQASFCPSQKWSDKYTRTRHRSVRCFPSCAQPRHKERSFCGGSLHINLDIPETTTDDATDAKGTPISQARVKEFRIDCCFRSTHRPLWLSVGDVWTPEAKEKCDEDLVRARFVSFDSDTRRAVFRVEPPRKWQYNFQRDTKTALYSSKFDNGKHCFAAFVVDSVTKRCIGQCDSPPFRVVSAWKREACEDSASRQASNQVLRAFEPSDPMNAFSAKRRAISVNDGHARLPVVSRFTTDVREHPVYHMATQGASRVKHGIFRAMPLSHSMPSTPTLHALGPSVSVPELCAAQARVEAGAASAARLSALHTAWMRQMVHPPPTTATDIIPTKHQALNAASQGRFAPMASRSTDELLLACPPHQLVHPPPGMLTAAGTAGVFARSKAMQSVVDDVMAMQAKLESVKRANELLLASLRQDERIAPSEPLQVLA